MTIVNSQRACILPVVIFNHVFFICITFQHLFPLAMETNPLTGEVVNKNTYFIHWVISKENTYSLIRTFTRFSIIGKKISPFTSAVLNIV